MTHEEANEVRNVSISVIALANDLLEKVNANDQIISERKISVETTDRLTGEIVNVLRHAASDASSSVDSAEVKLGRLIDIISSLISSMESSSRLSREDLIRLEATQEGMRRALTAVKNEGQLKLQEAEVAHQTAIIADAPETARKRSSRKIISEG